MSVYLIMHKGNPHCLFNPLNADHPNINGQPWYDCVTRLSARLKRHASITKITVAKRIR